MVYRELLASLVVRFSKDHPVPYDSNDTKDFSPAIFRVSKEVKKESKNIFYEEAELSCVGQFAPSIITERSQTQCRL